MVKINTVKFQGFRCYLAFYLLFLLFFLCPKLWASQEAMVLPEKALIYSDTEMTSPIGYISRGKKIVVGEIPRNKAQVYPIVVSGKVAYIRVIDVTTEKESADSKRLVAERFFKVAHDVPETKFVISYFAFNSQISTKNENGRIKDGDPLYWHGFSVKGEVFVKKAFDIQVIFNHLFTNESDATYRVNELGVGVAYRLINSDKFKLRLEAQALSIPFATYEIGEDFMVKSFGYTLGAGVNSTYLLDMHWGIEASAGFYRTSISEFDAPPPYKDQAPVFFGNRIGLGLNYTY